MTLPASPAFLPLRRLRVVIGAPLARLYQERDRWFCWLPVWFAIGIAVYFRLPHEPSLNATLAALATAALTHVYTSRTPALQHATLLTGALLLALAGFSVAALRTATVAAPVLPVPLNKAELHGRVSAVEQRPGDSRRLTLAIERIEGLPSDLTPAVIVIHQRQPKQPLALGERIRLTADLRPPSPPAQPGGFDFARQNYFDRIGAIGFTALPVERLPEPAAVNFFEGLSLRLARLRRAIGQRIEAALPGETGALANALMTGERSGITKATNEAYRDAGIFHILSISGLHMAIMGGSVFFALRFVLAAFPPLALNYPIKKWAAACAALATFAYLLIAGGAHATIRSFLMISIMFLAILVDRPAIALRNVAIAAFAILAFAPESLFNAGFQLSFAAVTALVAGYEAARARAQHRRRQGHARTVAALISPGWLRPLWLFTLATIATTLIAGLATSPFVAFHFHKTQTFAVAGNLLAVPLSNLIVMPAALAAFIAMPFGLEAYPLAVMGWGIDAMSRAARWVASWPGATITVPAYPELALQVMLAGALWLAIWRTGWRWLGVIVIVAGVGLAGRIERPDVLVGEGGRLVAVREAQRLSAFAASGTTFALERWLLADGDPRPADEVRKRRPFRCDRTGCTTTHAGHRISVPHSPAAVADDCRRAEIVVLTFPRPPGCQGPATVLDATVLREHGAHAITYAASGPPRIRTVEASRGNRPWTRAGTETARRRYWQHKYRKVVETGETIGQDGHPRRQDEAAAGNSRGKPPARIGPDPLDPDWDDGYPIHWGRWR